MFAKFWPNKSSNGDDTNYLKFESVTGDYFRNIDVIHLRVNPKIYLSIEQKYDNKQLDDKLNIVFLFDVGHNFGDHERIALCDQSGYGLTYPQIAYKLDNLIKLGFGQPDDKDKILSEVALAAKPWQGKHTSRLQHLGIYGQYDTNGCKDEIENTSTFVKKI